MKIFRSSQIREIDHFTIQNEPIKSIDLMERAASTITQWIIQNIEKTKKYLVLTVPCSNIPVSPKHFRHYDPELLKKHLKGFKMNVSYFCESNWITRAMLQILANRFFTVKTHYLINPIFKIYEKFFKNANEKTGVHLFAVGEIE